MPAPVATDDVFDIQPEYFTTIPFSALLSNDADADGGPLTITGVDAPDPYVEFDAVNQLLRVNTYYQFDLRGTYSFNYTVADTDGNTDTGQVSVTYGKFPLPPFVLTVEEKGLVFVTNYSQSSLGSPVYFGDPEHGSLTYELVDGGPFTDVFYVPDPGYVGTDAFTIEYYQQLELFNTREVLITVTEAAPPPSPSAYVRGTAGADLLDRSTATERVQIAGLGGNDTLRGGAGNDALNGGAGNDVLSGGAGNDVITGGTGADRMSGGRGDDTFLIGAGDLGLTNATDQIVDFQGAGAAGGDLIRFTGFGAGAALALTGQLGNSLAYEVHDAGGISLGRLLVSAGGAPGAALAAGDYVFA